jgi:hypothetical protein
MTVDATHPSSVTKQGLRPTAGAVEVPGGGEGGTTGSPIVRQCSEQGVLCWPRRLLLRWMRRLLLQRMHPWPHRDGADLGIVEGGPRWGAHAIVAVVVVGATRAIVLAFPLSLALTLTLAFATVVGVRGRRGRGHLRTQRFLLWWVWRQLLLQREPST